MIYLYYFNILITYIRHKYIMIVFIILIIILPMCLAINFVKHIKKINII